MKNKLIYSLGILVIILSIGFYSCDKENSEQTNVPSSQLTNKEGDEPLVIGNFNENGVFIFSVDKSQLLENWNYNLKELVNVDAQLTSLVVFKDDGKHFIQARGETRSSTIPLTAKVFGGGGIGDYYGEGISCTSEVCASSSTECVPKPDKKSCTDCTSFGTSYCTKTVTARSIFDFKMSKDDLIND